MKLTAVLAAVREHQGFTRAEAAADVRVVSALHPWLVAAAAMTRQVLAVTATSREAEDLVAALRCLMPASECALFPAWETLPHERLSPSHDTVGARIELLRRLHSDATAQTPTLRVIVAPVRAVVQPIVRGVAAAPHISVAVGDEIGRDALVAQLIECAYARTDLVEKRGQFAVRGAIVDVFPPTAEHPVRVEFFGDEIEEMRAFSVADQRSLGALETPLHAPACRELLLTAQVRERAAQLLNNHPELVDILEPLSQGIPVDGMEAMAAALADGMDMLTDLLTADAQVMVCDVERVRSRAHDVVATSAEFLAASWENAALGNQTPIDFGGAAYREWNDIHDAAIARGLSWQALSPFRSTEIETSDVETSILDDTAGFDDVTAVSTYRGDMANALRDIESARAAGWRVVLCADGHGTAARYVESFKDADIPAALIEDELNDLPLHVVQVVQAQFSQGFRAPSLKLLFLTESDVLGSRAASRDGSRMPSRRRRGIDPLQLTKGDYIVHEHHGVGRYQEMLERTVGGATREYLVIEYAASKRGQPPDLLYVPTDQLDLVTRYIGGEAPSLHKLGGGDWAATKSRARKAVREIAHELIRLYAARQSAKGHSFGPDTVWQQELEDAFPYVETPDQLACIQEVKADMEKSVPMDRLVCGDVGYGKTEIAVRAAFKAVQDGKQVAVLVPTTLLVQQHIATFSGRYAPFPVKVAALSRFQTDKEAQAVYEGLTDGTTDIVIGTHRLLGANVRFKDLGLVIVDEEQRFGVEHKEHLKALRTNVDMLSMSATPIPRTLEMAITGIREMSTIATPPEERHPILTYVGAYNDAQIAAAVRREMLRDGQVFFVHNRVESIERVASRLRELVPEARVVTAHGQMNEHVLEQIIVDFWEKKFDVLVSTTIVESGLDIPNANTLIVDRADTFGLSQLHQLRGRVGRGRERAYAYFMYRPDKPLTETAYDRLATIAQHTELGAGMSVAMKDLEIRGAGNLLGAQQSGHIAEVGFDLYVRMVAEAVADMRHEPTEQTPADVRIELPINAHIPHDYIEHERLRLEAYQRLAAAATPPALEEVAQELLDRYGSMPEPLTRLIEVARLRISLRALEVTEVVIAGANVRLSPVDLPESRQLRLTRLYPGSSLKPVTRTLLTPAPRTAKVGGVVLRDQELLSWLEQFISAVLVAPAPVNPESAGGR
ncbi:MAG: transcription-repair coupling factor [Actinobacteria bacterium]|nr:transcription-repair coupling factor [Actinomycetota bacterium]